MQILRSDFDNKQLLKKKLKESMAEEGNGNGDEIENGIENGNELLDEEGSAAYLNHQDNPQLNPLHHPPVSLVFHPNNAVEFATEKTAFVQGIRDASNGFHSFYVWIRLIYSLPRIGSGHGASIFGFNQALNRVRVSILANIEQEMAGGDDEDLLTQAMRIRTNANFNLQQQERFYNSLLKLYFNRHRRTVINNSLLEGFVEQPNANAVQGAPGLVAVQGLRVTPTALERYIALACLFLDPQCNDFFNTLYANPEPHLRVAVLDQTGGIAASRKVAFIGLCDAMKRAFTQRSWNADLQRLSPERFQNDGITYTNLRQSLSGLGDPYHVCGQLPLVGDPPNQNPVICFYDPANKAEDITKMAQDLSHIRGLFQNVKERYNTSGVNRELGSKIQLLDVYENYITVSANSKDMNKFAVYCLWITREPNYSNKALPEGMAGGLHREHRGKTSILRHVYFKTSLRYSWRYFLYFSLFN